MPLSLHLTQLYIKEEEEEEEEEDVNMTSGALVKVKHKSGVLCPQKVRFITMINLWFVKRVEVHCLREYLLQLLSATLINALNYLCFKSSLLVKR